MSSFNAILTVSASPKSLSMHESSISIIEDLQTILPYLQDTSHIDLFSDILSKLSSVFTSFKHIENKAKSSILQPSPNPSVSNKTHPNFQVNPVKSSNYREISKPCCKSRINSAKPSKAILKQQERQNHESIIVRKMKGYQKRWQGNIDKLQEIVNKRTEFPSVLIKKFAFIANEQLVSVLGTESKASGPRLNDFVHSKNPSNDSVEFERCMAELDKNKSLRPENPCEISIEKSFGGWKSEFDSDCESSFNANHEEVRSAIQVLEKANLLQPKYVNRLGSILELLVEDRKFENIGQVLDCVDRSSTFNSTKPPLGNFLNRTQQSFEELSLTASRDVDDFEVNLGLTSTIQSKFSKASLGRMGLKGRKDLQGDECLKELIGELDLDECFLPEKDLSYKIESEITECTLQGKVLADALGNESCYSFSLNL